MIKPFRVRSLAKNSLINIPVEYIRLLEAQEGSSFKIYKPNKSKRTIKLELI